ncbi:EP300-interacting inhibitor of differentiation 2 [Perognathus longimembris pacificus]|uniref:EP300-interacting inhibitor of differentiation 2 n=1 Tax=Perognathus longimembris pacificus TaxID=214514 RepID=UPI0020189254|nr:EP300-interacting inhibitor of differentiation 2 [Perognathus longimembris pacificus]
MSQLPADSSRSDPPTGAASRDGDAPPAEVGGGRRAPAAALREESRGGPMAEAQGGPAAEVWDEPVAAARDGAVVAVAAAAGDGRMAETRGGGPAAAAAAAARGGPMAAAAAAAARDARMAEVARLLGEPLEEEAPESRPRSRSGHAGALAALPYLRLRHPLSVLGINYQQFLRHYLENYPIAPGRIQELEERRRRFVEACRAREAAFDAEYHRNPQRVDFDILTFTIALTASEVINPLIEELGCDKFINRE